VSDNKFYSNYRYNNKNKKYLEENDIKIYGLIRVRNEEEIIGDSLDHMGCFCTGGIFVYDDCSTDQTVRICQEHFSVNKVIQGIIWGLDRAKAEFENRAAVLHEAKKVANSKDWLVYLDADERVVFDWSKLYSFDESIIGIKMRLFDFYITSEDANGHYFDRKYLGPEYRDILIAFRNLTTLKFEHLDQREVTLGAEGKILQDGFVKHYGKAISVKEWENTCEYYSNYFSMYSEKWKKRKGKAIHEKYSDFGNEPITWDEKEAKGIDLYELETNNNQKLIEKKLKILITNHHYLEFQGSELFTLNLIEYLISEGHSVILYTKYIGKLKIILDRINVKVVNDLEIIKDENFDIAHIHHNILAIEVRYYFPNLPIVFMSHGVIPFLEQPPRINLGIENYLAVSDEVKENLIYYGIESNKIEIFRNKVSPSLFKEENQINKNPSKALVISNKIDINTEKIIFEACSLLNIDVEFIGSRFKKVSPKMVAKKINSSDIVFSLGRGVIETMMCGRIPIIFDLNGGDGIVQPHNVKEYMKKNFSGRTNNKMFTVDEIVKEIRKYKYENGRILKEIASELFNSDDMNIMVNLYKKTIENKVINLIEKKDINISECIVNTLKETKHYERIQAELKLSELRIENAEYLIEIGDLEKAKEILIGMSQKDEDNLEVQNDLAVIAIMEERYAEAQKIIQYILNKDNSDEIAVGNNQYLNELLNSKKF